MKVEVCFLLFLSSVVFIYSEDDFESEDEHTSRGRRNIQNVKQRLMSQEYWNEIAQETLKKSLFKKVNTNIAKNVILFLGDGMSMQTITASRIYQGQLNGNSGEEEYLSFEEFPYVGMAKTYCADSQVADSACSATAYLGGVKSNEATIGVSANVGRTDCNAMRNASNHVSSIAQWAQNAGKSTGFVTTTRVTYASPAGLYAHVAERGWEDDAAVAKDGLNATFCPDIAQQLIYDSPGVNFNVIMGGGRRNFYPQHMVDAEGIKGRRQDGRNLIEVWLKDKIKRKSTYAYVTKRSQLLELNPHPDYLLGLFAPNHMEYHLDGKSNEPSLKEMTESAIKVLRRNPNGFFLFVEGGKIDHAHHDNMAKKALDETVEFSKAVSKAAMITNEDDTLIVVTSDHSHVMTISGYGKKGNNILGLAGEDSEGSSYSTLSYANGPGYQKPDSFGRRSDIKKMNFEDNSFKFPTMIPLKKETHGGDDVLVFARGPWSHLLSGSFEQHFIPHALGFAACLGKGLTACNQKNTWVPRTIYDFRK